MKKLLSVILTIAIAALFICPISVSAANDPTVEVSSATVSAGDEFEATVSLKDNPGITSMKLKVEFDNDAFTLNKVAYGEKFAGNAQEPEKLESPVTLNWLKPSKKGDANVEDSDVFATLSFTALKEAAGKKNITVTYDPEDVYNTDETNVTFKVTGGEISVAGADGDIPSEAVTATGDEKEFGDYTGKEVDPFTGESLEDDDPDVAEAEEENKTKDSEKSKAPVIWIFAVIAAVLIAAAVVLVIVKKRFSKKPIE